MLLVQDQQPGCADARSDFCTVQEYTRLVKAAKTIDASPFLAEKIIFVRAHGPATRQPSSSALGSCGFLEQGPPHSTNEERPGPSVSARLAGPGPGLTATGSERRDDTPPSVWFLINRKVDHQTGDVHERGESRRFWHKKRVRRGFAVQLAHDGPRNRRA